MLINFVGATTTAPSRYPGTLFASDTINGGQYVVRCCCGVCVLSVVPPRITRGPLSRAEVEGSSVTLQCRVVAAPFPDTVISWTKDARPVDVRTAHFAHNVSHRTAAFASVQGLLG